MSKPETIEASEQAKHGASCGSYPATVCWAVATLLVKDEVVGSRRIVTRRVLASSCLASSKEEAIGAETVAMLNGNEGFSLEAVVAVEAITPNGALHRQPEGGI